jgi:uncharacterized damage-inducible protein DinB
MNLADLTTLLDFHYWARNRVLDAAALLTPEQYTRDLGSSFPSVRDTLVHLYSAEWNWYQRWHGISPQSMLNPLDFPDVASLRAAWGTHEGKMRSFLDSLGEEGITQAIDYKALDGSPYRSEVWEMLHHVVNHGTYHRGQVQTMLRQLGASPAKSVDLIVFYRQKRAAAR